MAGLRVGAARRGKEAQTSTVSNQDQASSAMLCIMCLREEETKRKKRTVRSRVCVDIHDACAETTRANNMLRAQSITEKTNEEYG